MKTPRDIVESRLLERFSHRLFPLDEEHIPDVGRDKEGSYGFRYFSLSPYANGPNIVSMSTNFPRGLIYQDEGAMFGVGVFYRDQKKMTPTIHIIAPRGENWTRAVNEFSFSKSASRGFSRSGNCRSPPVIRSLRHITETFSSKLP